MGISIPKPKKTLLLKQIENVIFELEKELDCTTQRYQELVKTLGRLVVLHEKMHGKATVSRDTKFMVLGSALEILTIATVEWWRPVASKAITRVFRGRG